MGYKVMVVGPSGRETFLTRGREVSNPQTATWYPHPSNAERAAASYRKKCAAKSRKVLVTVTPY